MTTFLEKLDELIASVIESKQVFPRGLATIFGSQEDWLELPKHPSREPAESLFECVLRSLPGRVERKDDEWYTSSRREDPNFLLALIMILDAALKTPKSRRQQAFLHSAMGMTQRASAYRHSRIQQLAPRVLDHFEKAVALWEEFEEDAFRISQIRLEMGTLRFDAYGDEEAVRLLSLAIPEDPWLATPGLYFGVASRILRLSSSAELDRVLRELRPKLALAYACITPVDCDVPRYDAPRRIDGTLQDRLLDSEFAQLARPDPHGPSRARQDRRRRDGLTSSRSRRLLPDRMAILTLLALSGSRPGALLYAREATLWREICRDWIEEHSEGVGLDPLYSELSVTTVLDVPLDEGLGSDGNPLGDTWPGASVPDRWNDGVEAQDDPEGTSTPRLEIARLTRLIESGSTLDAPEMEARLLCRRAHLRLEIGDEGSGIADVDRALRLGGMIPDPSIVLRANAIRARYYRWQQRYFEGARCRNVWLNVCAFIGEAKYSRIYFPPSPKDPWSTPFEPEGSTPSALISEVLSGPSGEVGDRLYRLHRLATQPDRCDEVARAFATSAGEALLRTFPDERALPPTRGLLKILSTRPEETLARSARARFAESLKSHLRRTSDEATRDRLIQELGSVVAALALDPDPDENLLLFASHAVKTGGLIDSSPVGEKVRMELQAQNACHLDYLVGRAGTTLVVRDGEGCSFFVLEHEGAPLGADRIRAMFARVAYPIFTEEGRSPIAHGQAGLGALDAFLTACQASGAGEESKDFGPCADTALQAWSLFGQAVLPSAARERMRSRETIYLSTSGVLDNVPLQAVLWGDSPLHLQRSVIRTISPLDVVRTHAPTPPSGEPYFLVDPQEGGKLVERFGASRNAWDAARAPEEHVKAMSNASVVLMLAHGIVSDDRGECRVCLANGARLESRELRSYSTQPLRGQTVLLMACSGARTLGRARRSKARFSSLGRSFVQAGASHVLGCLWEVDTSRSVQFTAALLDAIREGASPDEALRQASSSLSAQERHPMMKVLVSAPYVLLG